MHRLMIGVFALALCLGLFIPAKSEAGVRVGINVGGYGNPYQNGRFGGYAPYPGYITIWVNDVVVNHTVVWSPQHGGYITVPVYYPQRRLVTAHWDNFRGGYWYWSGAGIYTRAR